MRESWGDGPYAQHFGPFDGQMAYRRALGLKLQALWRGVDDAGLLRSRESASPVRRCR